MQKRVLVVDDNEESRLLITICLKKHPEIFQANSGFIGLKILEQISVDFIREFDVTPRVVPVIIDQEVMQLIC